MMQLEAVPLYKSGQDHWTTNSLTIATDKTKDDDDDPHKIQKSAPDLLHFSQKEQKHIIQFDTQEDSSKNTIPKIHNFLSAIRT